MKKKLLFVASEGLPFVKSGGLADVIGSLPKELVKEGLEVSVVLPLYTKIIARYFDQLEHVGTYLVSVAKFNTTARLFRYEIEGVKFYFIEHAGYFERENLYGYGDDGERFSFFQQAIYQIMMQRKEYPDIIHAHDWHTGMMAALGRIRYAADKQICRIKQIYTIHNLAYQGNFSADILSSCLDLPMSLFQDGTLRFNDGISFMKAGIVFADKISTVSNTYSKEILGHEFGERMDEVLRLRQHDLWGIVNGIDLDSNNPYTDNVLAKNYDVNSLENKVANKRALQRRLGLRESSDICVVGMVSRLTWQKGVNLIINKMKDIMGLDIQLVILGTGDASYEYDLRQCEQMYKRRMVYYGGYSDEVARMIYAGADLFLMPSLFEPCGISQLIAMRYGTLPIVRETGGLKDTVEPYNQYEKRGTGFSFYHFSENDFYQVLRMAVDLYYLNPSDFKMLQQNAMRLDVSWQKSAQLYLQMYQETGA